jgi:Tol biopolymer transport system component
MDVNLPGTCWNAETGRITFASDREDGAPSFSPDGSSVAFESHRGADEEKPASIWIIELND